MSGSVHKTDAIEIETPDGERLIATLYEPEGAPKAALQIHGGIGVKRQFYRHFASYLASQGYAVLSFDFRGTGGSRPKSLRGYRAALRDWGQKDIPAALAWLGRRYPGLPKFAIGHSMGGQLTGLMHNHDELSGLVLIFAATGHFRSFPLPFRLYPMFILYLFFPLAIPFFGYAPARLVTTGEDLPTGVAREWIKWTQSSGYLGKHLRGDAGGFFYPEIKLPVRAFAVDDDPMATPQNCQNFLYEYFPRAELKFSTLRSRDAPNGRVGHLGYFRRALADSYWSQVTTWLDEQLAARSQSKHPAHAAGSRRAHAEQTLNAPA